MGGELIDEFQIDHLAIFPESGHSDREAWSGGSTSHRLLPACCSMLFRICNGPQGAGLLPKTTNELILFIPREIGIIGAQTLVRRGS